MARTARSGDAESCAYAGDHQLQLTQGDQGTMPQPPFWLLFIRVRRRRILRTSPYRISRKSSCGMRHRRTGDTAQGYAAPTFALDGGRRLRGSPIPLQAAIKAHLLRKENAHLRRTRRLSECYSVLQSRRAGFAYIPPSKAARLSSCSCPGPMRCPSYVQYGCQVMCRT
jgi:hypothetical protein